MREQAYEPDHPAHPDNAGKPYHSPGTPLTNDYMPGTPARGGQGQTVPTEAASFRPRQGYRHLHGLEGHTLAELEKSFAALPREEQAARMKWNETGIPAQPAEE